MKALPTPQEYGWWILDTDGWSKTCENQVGQLFLSRVGDLEKPTEVLGHQDLEKPWKSWVADIPICWLVYGNNQSFGQSLLYVPWFHLKWFLHFWCIEIIDQKQIILAKRQGSNPPFDLTPHVFIIIPLLRACQQWTCARGQPWVVDILSRIYVGCFLQRLQGGSQKPVINGVA